jgi:hypothetical protein
MHGDALRLAPALPPLRCAPSAFYIGLKSAANGAWMWEKMKKKKKKETGA